MCKGMRTYQKIGQNMESLSESKSDLIVFSLTRGEIMYDVNVYIIGGSAWSERRYI